LEKKRQIGRKIPTEEEKRMEREGATSNRQAHKGNACRDSSRSGGKGEKPRNKTGRGNIITFPFFQCGLGKKTGHQAPSF